MAANALDRWWSRSERQASRETAQQTALRLGRKVRRTRVAERRLLLRHIWTMLLQHRHDYAVALFLLDDLTDERLLDDLAKRLVPLPDRLSADQEAYLADLMRILAAAGRLAPVEDYLLQRPLGPFWHTVPWALWPRHRTLFVRAWQRVLAEGDAGSWDGAPVIRPFLADAQAIRAVRAALESTAWDALRAALQRHARASHWLAADHRRAFEQAIS